MVKTAKMTPEMAKMTPELAETTPKMAKFIPKITPKMVKMSPKMANMTKMCLQNGQDSRKLVPRSRSQDRNLVSSFIILFLRRVLCGFLPPTNQLSLQKTHRN